jgi:hypothetical protein
MKKHLVLTSMLLLICAFAFAARAQAQEAVKKAVPRAQSLVKVPLSFEMNRGQATPAVQFVSRGSGYSLLLSPGNVALNLERQQQASVRQLSTTGSGAVTFDSVRMKLIGANESAQATALEPQAGVVSYLIGNDPKKWHSGIPTYGKISYGQIYPGVDLVFYGNQRQLEYDLVVAPGSDPSRIVWQIDGASAALDPDGNLQLNAANGPASFKKPVLYQMNGDKKTPVQGSFAIAGSQVHFQLGSYDHSKSLIIDPVLSYATYLGGTGTDNIGSYIGPGNQSPTQAVAVDKEGSVYVTGYTYSTDFPTQSPYESTPPTKMTGISPGGWASAFVTKFSPDGSSLVYSTYLGGNGYDYGFAIAVDGNGNAYITGSTTSPDFPVTPGAYQTVCSPIPDFYHGPNIGETSSCNSFYNASAFVTKLNSTGTGLVYSTFLSGEGNDGGVAIAIDPAGRAYVAGNATGYCYGAPVTPGPYPYTCFPTTAGAVIGGTAISGYSQQNGFVAVFDPAGAHCFTPPCSVT